MNKDKLKSVLIRAREYVMTAKQNAETRREYYMDDGQSEIMNDARSLISEIDSIIKEVDNDQGDGSENARTESLRDSAIRELEDYKKLKDGWDGYCGKIFDDNLFMQNLTILLSKMFIEADIVPDEVEITPGPASDGSIDLEIRFDSKQYIITVYSD